jgi:hypothetical protein
MSNKYTSIKQRSERRGRNEKGSNGAREKQIHKEK